MTLGPYLLDTETLYRDLAVRLQTSENQNLAKLPLVLEKNITFLLVVCESQACLEVKV